MIHGFAQINILVKGSTLSWVNNQQNYLLVFWASSLVISFSVSFKSQCKRNERTKHHVTNTSFLYFSVQGTYGTEEKFIFILPLVLFLCIFNAIVSKISKADFEVDLNLKLCPSLSSGHSEIPPRHDTIDDVRLLITHLLIGNVNQ